MLSIRYRYTSRDLNSWHLVPLDSISICLHYSSASFAATSVLGTGAVKAGVCVCKSIVPGARKKGRGASEWNTLIASELTCPMTLYLPHRGKIIPRVGHIWIFMQQLENEGFLFVNALVLDFSWATHRCPQLHRSSLPKSRASTFKIKLIFDYLVTHLTYTLTGFKPRHRWDSRTDRMVLYCFSKILFHRNWKSKQHLAIFRCWYRERPKHQVGTSFAHGEFGVLSVPDTNLLADYDAHMVRCLQL